MEPFLNMLLMKEQKENFIYFQMNLYFEEILDTKNTFTFSDFPLNVERAPASFK